MRDVPKPSLKITTVLQAKNFAAVERAAVDIRLQTGKAISRAALIDRLIEQADMATLIESYRKAGK